MITRDGGGGGTAGDSNERPMREEDGVIRVGNATQLVPVVEQERQQDVQASSSRVGKKVRKIFKTQEKVGEETASRHK